MPAGVAVGTVADRAADLFDLFALPRPPGCDLLVRAAHDRRVTADTRRLWRRRGPLPAAWWSRWRWGAAPTGRRGRRG